MLTFFLLYLAIGATNLALQWSALEANVFQPARERARQKHGDGEAVQAAATTGIILYSAYLVLSWPVPWWALRDTDSIQQPPSSDE